MGSGGSLGRRSELAGREVRRFRPSWRWLRGVARSAAVSALALTLTFWLVPGEQVPGGDVLSVVSLALVVLGLGALLRPLLVRFVVVTGVWGLLVTGFLAQSLVLGLALAAVPSIQPIDFPEIVLAAWLVAVLAAVINWVVDASGEEVHLAQVMGRTVSTARRTDVTGPGLLVVQLDGVSEPLLRQAAAAGSVPFLTSLLRSGSHRLREWHTGLPSTTPAGQAVLLHGDERAVPAFRWYDKEQGKVVQCSRPVDAGDVERGFTTGRGLLADDGASVANLFSGDAPFRALTMSHARLPGSEPGAAAYAASRSGFVRSMVLFVGQVATEWYQGRRQRYRDVVPRVRRGRTFVLLRGLTTVLLKDLSVAIVADRMARGTPVVFVDFLDYDEVAHHAGPTRPESVRTLESLDRVLRFFAEVSQEVGRDYELVVLSDHGQTQGSTYLQLAGRTLADDVDAIVDGDVDGPGGSPEVLGPANMLRTHGGRPAELVRRPLHRVVGASEAATDPAKPRCDVQVVAGGSIAHLYLPDHPGRLVREQVEAAAPGLVEGLRLLPYVGLVATRRADGCLVVEGGSGRVVLERRTGGPVVVEASGEDPTAVYGPTAVADLLDLDRRDHVGDVVALGRYDPGLHEVAAFEELVGSHGGLGGDQTRALFVHPADWAVPDRPLAGIDVHRLLVDRLLQQGLRRPETDAPSPEPSPAGVGS
ncbi:alkaline phosphatase family protein [Nocardioides litoris]|uniref:alkaline phosphatase family protein n=1 Tax=Nocardioides litoris TaxID=1926648 RepID=UPI0011211887|nr:alkaline phosphatase family protein [Nocardioides litoris]